MTIHTEDLREKVARELQSADEDASRHAEDAALGLADDISDWGAYLAGRVLSLLSSIKEGGSTKPFAHFQWNDGWSIWEQVQDKYAGKKGVVAAYRISAAPSPPTTKEG